MTTTPKLEKFYTVYHVLTFQTYDFVRVIGIYSSRKNARDAVKRSRLLPGFKNYPRKFQVIQENFSFRMWTDGFIRVGVGKVDKSLCTAWNLPINSLQSSKSKKPTDAFCLSHVCCNDGYDEHKLIGYFRTRKEALATKRKYLKMKGFRDYPKGFVIDEYVLGRDCWVKGFKQVRTPSTPISRKIDLRLQRRIQKI